MQIPRTGDLVLVRRARWRVIDVRSWERCQVVTLQGAAAANAGVERRVLTPFETLHALRRRESPRFVGLRCWRRAFRKLVAEDAPPGSLRTAAAARIDLMPHQLEPALAVVRGLATRLLLADDVGLGKTVQAGLVVSELLRRGICERALIVTPAGLRDQWSEELSGRFMLRAEIVDGPLLRRAAVALPVGANPWVTAPLAIVSIDYLKRPEVLPAAAACNWDVIVVDEAHAACGDSDSTLR